MHLILNTRTYEIPYAVRNVLQILQDYTDTGVNPGDFEIKVNGLQPSAVTIPDTNDTISISSVNGWSLVSVTFSDQLGEKFKFVRSGTAALTALAMLGVPTEGRKFFDVDDAPGAGLPHEDDEIDLGYDTLGDDLIVKSFPESAFASADTGFAAAPVVAADTGFAADVDVTLRVQGNAGQAPRVDVVNNNGAAVQVAPVAAVPAPAPTIQVTLIDNDGTGLADAVYAPVGITLLQFLQGRKPGFCAASYFIRVNGEQQPTSGSRVLQNGDRISLTPSKVSGAAGSVRILFVSNDGSGFNDYVFVTEGTTVQQIFAQRYPGADPSRYYIRVNNARPSGGQVLRADDKVSVTPAKVAGA